MAGRLTSDAGDGRPAAVVELVMGSASDWETMSHAAQVLGRFAVPYRRQVVSAHRTPHAMVDFAARLRPDGVRCVIAGAGGAAHLPGMLAALTTVPVLGVPVASRHLNGLDSLLSIVQMPRGVPVATFAIGAAGAENAALFAVALLAADDPALAKRLDDFREAEALRIATVVLPEMP